MAHEHLHDLPHSDRTKSSLDATVEVLAALDNMGFDNPESRAMQAQLLLRQRGFQILPAIPMPRAIR